MRPSRAIVALSALVLAAFSAAPALAQTNFTTYVAIGDSLAAGFESNSLVETHQNQSVPALIARQAGVFASFQQPLISEPGIPPELTVVSLVPVPVVAPKSATSGSPKNLTLARPYNNLAVPGATSVDALTRVTDQGGLHDLILRGLGTQVQQAVALHPTAITLWIGNNDVLGAATRGRAIDGVTLTPTDTFRAVYGQIVASLKTTGAFIVAVNLPDVTTIPFVTTIKPYVTNPTTGVPVLVAGNRVPLLGPAGPLPSTAFVTLAASTLLAQGIGIPAALGGTGAPLPDEVVLDPTEVAIIRDHVDADNQAIRDICGAANIPILDVHAILGELATSGRTIGGITLTSAYLSGGVFSYDGVHPNDIGYAIVANELVAVINAHGGALPPVDLGAVLGVTATSAATMAARAGALRASSSRWVPFEFSGEAYADLLAAFPTVDRRP
jgi:lysophospholipase L1-like esterase